MTGVAVLLICTTALSALAVVISVLAVLELRRACARQTGPAGPPGPPGEPGEPGQRCPCACTQVRRNVHLGPSGASSVTGLRGGT